MEVNHANFPLFHVGVPNLARLAPNGCQASFPNLVGPALEVGQDGFLDEGPNQPILDSNDVEIDLDDWRAPVVKIFM